MSGLLYSLPEPCSVGMMVVLTVDLREIVSHNRLLFVQVNKSVGKRLPTKRKEYSHVEPVDFSINSTLIMCQEANACGTSGA